MKWLKKAGIDDPSLLVLCLALALVQGAIFVGIQVKTTGTVSFPLDDSYIHLQYARQIAQGQFFQYQDGDPVSSGATSVLYALLLAGGYWIGFRGALFVLWPLLIAGISLSVMNYFLIKLGKRLGTSFTGWSALLLTCSSGILAWGLWSGMEIALFSALLALVFYRLFSPQPLRPSFLILVGCLSLCRPEGVIVSVVLIGGVLIHSSPKSLLRKHLCNMKTILAAGFFLVALLGPMVFFRLTTGQWGGNGLQAKSLLNHPILTGQEILLEYCRNLGSIGSFLIGAYQGEVGEFVIPGLLVFILIGLVDIVVRQGRNNRWLTLAMGGALAAVFVAIATLEVWPMHNYRYLLPFYPLLLLLGVLGIERACSWINTRDRVLRGFIVILALLVSGIQYPVWASRFAENATTIHEKQGKAARWISKKIPPQSVIAINDAGVLAYSSDLESSGQRIVDLIGLVTNGPTVLYRMGEGGLYEWMERLPDEDRPQYAVVFPSWFKQMSQVYDVFYDPLVTFPDPFDPGFSKSIYRVNWNYSDQNDEPRESTMQPGWKVRDRLDVADIHSELAHEYSFDPRARRFPKIPIPFQRNFGYHEEIDLRWPGIEKEQEELIPVLKKEGSIYRYDILDAGRRISGEESFIMDHLTPGQDAFLILRTCDDSGKYPLFQYSMDVFVGNHFVQPWTVEGTPWNWYETVVKIPADLVQESRISIRIVNQGTSTFSHYGSYYYWIVQE